MHATKTHRCDRIFNVTGNNDSNRNLPVIRSIRSVERAITITESHFAFDDLLQILLKLPRLRKTLVLGSVM